MKRIVIAFVLLITFCAFLPSVLAEENGYIYTIDSVSASLTPSGQKLTAEVTNLSNQQTDDLIVAAAYSYENELLNLYSAPLSIWPMDTDTYHLTIKADTGDISYIKVFIWDSFENLSPLAKEWTAAPVKPLDFAVLLSAKNDKVKLLCNNGLTESYTASESTLSAAQDILNSGATAKDRIVTYNINNVTGEIDSVTKAVDNSAINTTDVNLQAFKLRTSKLGTHTIYDDTIIIDATQAEKGLDKSRYYTVTDKTGLVDGEYYTGYVFNQDEYVSLVVITKIGADFEGNSRFAVIQDDPMEHYTDDDEKCELVLTLAGGRNSQEMLFRTGVYEDSDLGIGDAIFYTQDSSGFVNAVYKVYDHSEGTFTKLSDVVDNFMLIESDWSYNLWDEGNPIQLTTGAIIDVNYDTLTFASLEQVKTGSLDTNLDLNHRNEDGVVTYDISDYAEAYIYEVNSDEYIESRKFKATDITRIKASNLSDYETEDGVYENIDMSKVNEALVMIVDGEIAEIYVIEK